MYVEIKPGVLLVNRHRRIFIITARLFDNDNEEFNQLNPNYSINYIFFRDDYTPEFISLTARNFHSDDWIVISPS